MKHKKKTKDLHGAVSHKCELALLIVDVISDFSFPGGASLANRFLKPAENIRQLKQALKKRKVPTIYANDNFGNWRSDFRYLIEHCLKEKGAASRISKLLEPEKDDYFVLKSKHSAFYSTNLELLLRHIGAKSIILTGLTSQQCLLFTANDAYMRDFGLYLPRDCSVATSPADYRPALTYFEKVLKADTSRWKALLKKI